MRRRLALAAGVVIASASATAIGDARLAVAQSVVAQASSPAVVPAAQVEGVRIPERTTLDGEPLSLSSCGVRDTFWVEHFATALYTAPGVRGFSAMLDARQPIVVELRIVDSEWLPEGIAEKYRRALRRHLDERASARVEAAYADLAAGDIARIERSPVSGTRIAVNGQEVASAPSDGLVGAMLEAWAGEEDLRRKLRGFLDEHRC